MGVRGSCTVIRCPGALSQYAPPKGYADVTWKELTEGGHVIAGSPETVRQRIEELAKTARAADVFGGCCELTVTAHGVLQGELNREGGLNFYQQPPVVAEVIGVLEGTADRDEVSDLHPSFVAPVEIVILVKFGLAIVDVPNLKSVHVVVPPQHQLLHDAMQLGQSDGVRDEYSAPDDRFEVRQTHAQLENVGYRRPIGIPLTHPVRLRDAFPSRGGANLNAHGGAKLT